MLMIAQGGKYGSMGRIAHLGIEQVLAEACHIAPTHHARVRIGIPDQALLVDKDIQKTPWGVLVGDKAVMQHCNHDSPGVQPVDGD